MYEIGCKKTWFKEEEKQYTETYVIITHDVYWYVHVILWQRWIMVVFNGNKIECE